MARQKRPERPNRRRSPLQDVGANGNARKNDKGRACRNKRQYNKNQARTGASVMTKRAGVKFDYYQCEYCGEWHIGKRPEYFTGPDGVRFRAMEYFPYDQIIEREEGIA